MTQNSKDSHPGIASTSLCQSAILLHAEIIWSLYKEQCAGKKMEILKKIFGNSPHVSTHFLLHFTVFTYYFLFLWAFLKFPLAFLPVFYFRSHTAYIIFPLALWIWKEPLKLVCLFLLYLNLLFPSFPHSLFLSRHPHPLPLLLFFFYSRISHAKKHPKDQNSY